jgi:uncharacterized protein YecE (DUF72 family)
MTFDALNEGTAPLLMASGARVWISVSGWRYAPWRGVFYPAGLRQADELAYISRQFSSVELNGSFYSLQRPALYEAWREATPSSFVFAVKGGRYVTHMKRLANVEVPLANFFASGILCLGAKLGPLLWQLPPNLRFEAPVIERFLQLLPQDTQQMAKLAAHHDERLAGRSVVQTSTIFPVRHTLEVRHPSFCTPAFYDLLRAHSVACCIADSAGKFPQLDAVTAPFVYVRLHGSEELYISGYRPPELRAWAKRIRQWTDDGRDVYVYFDNDAKVKAPFDARNLIRALSGERLVPAPQFDSVRPAAVRRSPFRSAPGGRATPPTANALRPKEGRLSKSATRKKRRRVRALRDGADAS